MVVVRGLNVFPSQIEHALLGIEGLEPHYQIILSTRPDYQTDLSVRVEMSESVVAGPSHPRGTQKPLHDDAPRRPRPEGDGRANAPVCHPA